MQKVNSRYNQKIITVLLAAYGASFLISIFVMQIIAAVLFVLYLTEKNSEKIKAADVTLNLILLFGAVRFGSIIFSVSPEISLDAIPKELIFYISYVFLAFYFKAIEYEKLISVIKLTVFTGIAVSIIGIWYYNFTDIERARMFGGEYHTFSAFLIFILIFLFPFYSKLRSSLHKVLWGAAAAIVITGIVLALGRAALGIAILFFISGIFIYKIHIREIIIAMFLTAAISFISFETNSTNFVEKRVEKVTGASDRDVLYKAFFEIADDRILTGFGPRTFEEIFPLKDELSDKKIGSWHNDLIQFYIDSGVFLLIAFGILFLYSSHKTIIYLIRNRLTKEKNLILLASLMTFWALNGLSLTSSIWFSPVLSVILVFCLAIIEVFTERDKLPA